MEHPPLDDLSAALDDALPGPRAAQVAAHVAGCAQCRERQATLAWARAYTRALPPVTPGWVGEFQALAPARRARPGSPALVALGLAAGLLVALGLWLVLRPTPAPNQGAPTLADDRAATTPISASLSAATQPATATQAGYPRPLGTALASDLARLAAQSALAQTAAAAPSGTATSLPAASQTAFAAALSATDQALRQAQGAVAGAASPAPLAPTAGGLTTPAATVPAPVSPMPAAPAAPEWLPLVAAAVLCLSLGLLLLARRR